LATLRPGGPPDYDVPANARVESFIPHSILLSRAVCVVTHAGMGATQKALAAGVPVVAVPFGRDQSEVARRVEVSGAGTRLSASRLTGRRLAAKVAQARTCADRAQAVARAFADAGGAPRAATEVEKLASNSPPTRTSG
jgi:UDP:flavonoid glycosyltransferase YjiC (YdhE family)